MKNGFIKLPVLRRSGIFKLVVQMVNLCYNLSADRQGFKTSQNYHNFGLVALVLLLIGCQPAEKPNTGKQPDTEAAQTEIRYARNFGITRTPDYKQIEVYQPYPGSRDTLRYFLVNDKRTFTPPQSGLVIEVPLRRTLVFSAPHFGFLDVLKQKNTVVGVSKKAYFASPYVQQEQVRELGELSQASREVLLSLRPDATFLSAVSAEALDKSPRGVPAVFVSEWLENTPLGRTEWIKFFAAFYDQEDQATAWFDEVEAAYLQLKARTDQQEPVSCFTGSPFKGTWYMARGDSYITNLLEDAGARHLWDDQAGTGSLPLDLEVVYEKAKDADFWINANADSRQVLQEQHPTFAAFRAFGKNNVLVNTNNEIEDVNAYWTYGVTEPEVLLADLVSFFHPDLLPGHHPKYYQRLP